MSDPATLLALAIVAIVGYGIGSISSGYLVGKMYRNVDLRTVGSGSTGATNTFRTLGRGAGLLVAVFDILKGACGRLRSSALSVTATRATSLRPCRGRRGRGPLLPPCSKAEEAVASRRFRRALVRCDSDGRGRGVLRDRSRADPGLGELACVLIGALPRVPPFHRDRLALIQLATFAFIVVGAA